jgi:hypothetical protein
MAKKIGRIAISFAMRNLEGTAQGTTGRENRENEKKRVAGGNNTKFLHKSLSKEGRSEVTRIK